MINSLRTVLYTYTFNQLPQVKEHAWALVSENKYDNIYNYVSKYLDNILQATLQLWVKQESLRHTGLAENVNQMNLFERRQFMQHMDLDNVQQYFKPKYLNTLKRVQRIRSKSRRSAVCNDISLQRCKRQKVVYNKN